MFEQLIDTFLLVSNLGSFTQAAKQLYLSTTAVQKQINQLEQKTGLILFERRKKGVVLTNVGKIFYQKVVEIRRTGKKMLSDLQLIQNHSDLLRYIRVGTSNLIPTYYIKQWLCSLEKQDIDCNMELVPIAPVTNMKELDSLFQTNTIDCLCVYRYFPINEKKYDFCYIDDSRLCLAVPYNNPLSSKMSIRLEDLKNQTVITVKYGINETYDRVLDILHNDCENIEIKECSNPYTIDMFNDCVKNNWVLISSKIFEYGHPNLKTIPIEEKFAVPYGVIIKKDYN